MNRKGFTLIELLIVIAIIGILSTLAIIALANSRAKSRDAKRVADIKQISTALDLYYADYGYYPTIITPGNPLTSADGTKTYMSSIPNNPTPRNDGSCASLNYSYGRSYDENDYRIYFCLGLATSQLDSGGKARTTSGIINISTFPSPGTCGGQQQGTCPSGKECCQYYGETCFSTSRVCVPMGGCFLPSGQESCKNVDEACSVYSDCFSGICRGGVCSCNPIDTICDYSANCCSENCSNGVCQPATLPF